MPLHLIIAVLIFAAGGLLILERTRQRDSAFKPPSPKRPKFTQRLQRQLRRAGMTDTTPTAFMLVVGGIATMVYAAMTLLIGPFGAIFLVPIVFVVAYLFLANRQRSYLKRSADEMVPFLRKIQSHVRTGGNAQSAFILAVSETTLIGPAIEPIVVQMKLNSKPFIELLGDSREYMPFRVWSTFVRSMEMHNEVGGALDRTLDDTVKQINTMIRLRATARRYYGPMKTQQYFMVGAGAATAPISLVLMGGLFFQMFESFFGWVMFFMGLIIQLFGLFIAQRIIASVEKRIGD